MCLSLDGDWDEFEDPIDSDEEEKDLFASTDDKSKQMKVAKPEAKKQVEPKAIPAPVKQKQEPIL